MDKEPYLVETKNFQVCGYSLKLGAIQAKENYKP